MVSVPEMAYEGRWSVWHRHAALARAETSRENELSGTVLRGNKMAPQIPKRWCEPIM